MVDVHHPVLEPVPREAPDLRITGAPEEPAAELDAVAFETGLVRALVVGGVIGFLVVFVMVAGGFVLAGIDPVTSVLGGAFVGAFAGVGFGAMTGASIHEPPTRRSGDRS
jgi:hypothetical protein